jgi:hypothetical protein
VETFVLVSSSQNFQVTCCPPVSFPLPFLSFSFPFPSLSFPSTYPSPLPLPELNLRRQTRFCGQASREHQIHDGRQGGHRIQLHSDPRCACYHVQRARVSLFSISTFFFSFGELEHVLYHVGVQSGDGNFFFL